MRRKANIVFVVISVLIVLIAPFVPHHHHEGPACVVVERCLQNNTYTDNHTQHNGSSSDSSASSCVVNAQYLTSTAKQNNSVSKDNLNPDLQFLILIFHSGLLLNSDFDVSEQHIYGEPVDICEFAEIIGSNGLRAPPYLLA